MHWKCRKLYILLRSHNRYNSDLIDFKRRVFDIFLIFSHDMILNPMPYLCPSSPTPELGGVTTGPVAVQLARTQIQPPHGVHGLIDPKQQHPQEI